MFKILFTGFPDMHTTTDRMIAEGDLVAMKMSTTATNSGPFMDIPATNKPVKIDELHILRVQGGKIVEHWGLSDDLGMMTQMGLLAEPQK